MQQRFFTDLHLPLRFDTIALEAKEREGKRAGWSTDILLRWESFD